MPKKTSSTADTYTRSYLFKVDTRCNATKLLALETMQQEWQRFLPILGEHAWNEFLQGKPVGKPLNMQLKQVALFQQTSLVTSMKECMAVAVEGQLKTWKSNLQRRIARFIMRSSRYAKDADARHQLLWLNRMQLWRVPYPQQQKILLDAKSKTKVSHLDERPSALLARYLHAYLKRFKGPCFDNLPMQVNQLSSDWANTRSSRVDGVEHWLRISTLHLGKRIELPVRGNAYANAAGGTQATTFGLVKKKGCWYIKVSRMFEKAAQRSKTNPNNVLGLDTGMVNLVATSQGAIFGQGFNIKLRRWDERLQAITKGLQCAGEKRLSLSRRYRDFVARMRSWITSEINRAVKQVLALGQPHTVVIEALNFSAQKGTLSRKMNRLVRRMGTGVFKGALARHAQTQGFTVVEVNPAYTSQECSACRFISRANRKKNEFKCVCCGKQAHADAQASRTLVKRFHEGRVCEYVKHETLGMQGIDLWAANMCSRIEKSTPGSSRFFGVIGSARVGLKHLNKTRARRPQVQTLRCLLNGLSSGLRSTR